MSDVLCLMADFFQMVGFFNSCYSIRVQKNQTSKNQPSDIDILFPFNSSRRFAADVIYHPVDPFYIVDDLAGDIC